MKTTLTALAALAVLPAGMALADDHCSVSRAAWQSPQAVSRLADANGWTLHAIETDDGCYEIEARTRDGRRIEARLNPGTLDVMEIEDEGGADRNGRRRAAPAPAGSVTPPPNGLFGTGAPPTATVN